MTYCYNYFPLDFLDALQRRMFFKPMPRWQECMIIIAIAVVAIAVPVVIILRNIYSCLNRET